MERKQYFQPEIRVRTIEMEVFLEGGSIINTDNNDGNEDPGYGGGGIGPAYAPEFRNVWDE